MKTCFLNSDFVRHERVIRNDNDNYHKYGGFFSEKSEYINMFG